MRTLLRRKSWWKKHDPVVGLGVMGVDLDSGSYKLGNGQSRWSELQSATSSVQPPSEPSDPSEVTLYDGGAP